MFVVHPKLLFRSQPPLTTLAAAYEKVIETLISRQFRKFIVFFLYGEVGLHLPTFHKSKFLRLSKMVGNSTSDCYLYRIFLFSNRMDLAMEQV